MANYVEYIVYGKIFRDHRGQCIDIPQAALIGFHQQKNIPPLERNLLLDDPRTVTRFNTVLHLSFAQNVYIRIKSIHQHCGITPAIQSRQRIRKI